MDIVLWLFFLQVAAVVVAMIVFIYVSIREDLYRGFFVGLILFIVSFVFGLLGESISGARGWCILFFIGGITVCALFARAAYKKCKKFENNKK